MSGPGIYAKISVAEAHQWLKNAKEAWDDGRFETALFDDVISDTKPVDFKTPRKPRVTKESSSSSERSEQEHDEKRCDARVWLKGGFDAQCSCSKLSQQFLCKRHQGEADKNGGTVKNGMFNMERPTHHYGDESNEFIPWHDAEGAPKKTRKKSSAPRKCGCCGEPGHNKRKCPQNPDSVLKKSEPKPKKSAPIEEEQEPEPEPEPPIEQEPEPEPEPPIEQEPEPEPEPPIEQEPEPEPEPPIEEEPESDLVLTDEELDEDTSDNKVQLTDCTFEEIAYTRNAHNEVFDDEFDPVGTWEDGKIVFSNIGKKGHKFALAVL
jgi:hypothetical protein